MKNFKLLLASTAILSTGLVMGALADGETPTAATYTNRTSATLETSIRIFSPISMTNGKLDFPDITTTAKTGVDSVKVKVKPNGEIDYSETTAQLIGNGINNGRAYIQPIKITGGDVGDYKSAYTAEGADAAALDEYYNAELSGIFDDYYDVVVADSTIPMYIQNSDTSVATNHCGDVGSLERYWHYNTSLNGGKGGLELSFGGTFTLDSDFDPTDSGGGVRCIGSTTVTLFIH